MKNRLIAGICLASVCAGLAGCSKIPDSIEGSTWKLTELTAPDGTEYDEAAYDTIIGSTTYFFDTNGKMVCTVGENEDDSSYTYTYENGNLMIASDDMACPGTVENKRIELQLGTNGKAVLTRQ